MNVQEDDMALTDPEHVALKVRFFLSVVPPLLFYPFTALTNPTKQSNYTNSTHLLSRIKTSQCQSHTSGSLSLLACYDGQFDQVGFTVTAFAYPPDVVVSWDTRVPPARYMQKVPLEFIPLKRRR
jgi:calpain-7